jgi:hypothetical protein
MLLHPQAVTEPQLPCTLLQGLHPLGRPSAEVGSVQFTVHDPLPTANPEPRAPAHTADCSALIAPHPPASRLESPRAYGQLGHGFDPVPTHRKRDDPRQTLEHLQPLPRNRR